MFKKRSRLVKKGDSLKRDEELDNKHISDDDTVEAPLPKRQSRPVAVQFKKSLQEEKSSVEQVVEVKQDEVVALKPAEPSATTLTNTPCRIVTHTLTPPFLSTTVLSTPMQTSLIPPEIVRDKSGDLYRVAQAGSHLLNERRRAAVSAAEKNYLLDKRKRIEKVDQSEDDNISDTTTTTTDNTNTFSRKSLPAYKVRDPLLQLIDENQVVIVIGETGSGKTTQLPQFLYEKGYHNNGLIAITQPRRVAAVSVARRVSEEMNVNLGSTVGFTIRFNDTTSEETQIKFMTDGILLRETLSDPVLSKYSVVIMDEAHERSLNTDILFGILKKVLRERRDFKLIITSATMNSAKFAKFFNNAVQFKIPGKTYPVQIMYTQSQPTDYIDTAVKQAIKIHLSTPIEMETDRHGDILIFMTGQEDIETTCGALRDELDSLAKLENSNVQPLTILPIYSNLHSADQAKIFSPTKSRKCIIATNIAETSLTLNHVKYVIDSGLMKLKVYSPKLNMDLLQTLPISKAQADQRAGRAGRVCPGECYRLYTLSTYNEEMWDDPIPEIRRSNLLNTVLLLKNLNILNISSFPFIDPPSQDAIYSSQYELWAIGALDNFGQLTPLGRKLTSFPTDPILAKFLVLSNEPEFGCAAEAIRIVATLSVPPLFTKVKRNTDTATRAQHAWSNFHVPESDHLTLLNVFTQFHNLQNRPIREQHTWCDRNYLNFKALRNAVEIFNQLHQVYQRISTNITSCMDNWDTVRYCLSACLYTNAASFSKHGEYKHLRSGIEMYIPNTSVFADTSYLPEYVVFHELLLTGERQQMHCITAVDGDWLVKFGQVFYSRAVRGVTTRENQKHKELEFTQLVQLQRSGKI